jgi:hypothetical protein
MARTHFSAMIQTIQPVWEHENAQRPTVIQKGKKYRLRLLDAQADGWMKFSIDGHKLTVIAADLVPIVTYQTNSVILTSSQRYDVIFEANQDVGSYWMRAICQTACNGVSIGRYDLNGIFRYEGASQADPTRGQWSSITNSCGEEPYTSRIPYVEKDVSNAGSQKF